MKKYVFLLSTLIIMFVVESCSSKKGESDEQMVTAAKELDTKFQEAFNKGDVTAIMETYWNSPELVSFAPDAIEATNWDKTKEAMAKSFSAMKGARLELTNLQNKVAGEVVLGYGTFTFTLPDSAATKMNGRYTDVKSKKDGKWVYIMDHASMPLPPPPAQ